MRPEQAAGPSTHAHGPAAHKLSLPNLCACCVSDIHTCNIHAFDTDAEQYHTIMYFFYVIAWNIRLEKSRARLPATIFDSLLLDDLIFPLSKYFNLKLICIKHNVSSKKYILGMYQTRAHCSVYTSLTQHAHKLGRLNVIALRQHLPEFRCSV